MRPIVSIVSAFLLGAVAFASGCSSTSGSVTSADGGATSAPVTTRITAAAGGTVSAPGGKATLAIPAGALPADVDITLALSAASNGSVSEVFEFGPSGTTFSTPATLAIQLPAGATAPAGKSYALAVEESGAWKAIAGSSAQGGFVTGPVAHFSKFSVILVDGQAVAVSGCADVVTNFVACGGDVVGTWAWDDFCFRNQTLGSDPFQGKCPEAKLEAEFVREGDVVITATTVTVGAVKQTIGVSGTVPVSCLNGATCDAFGKGVYKSQDAGVQGSCTTTGATCTCSGPTEIKSEAAGQPETYKLSGNTFTVGDGAATEYCVKGDKLYVSDKSDKGYVYVLRKKN
ncbi:MAG: hypothetical protein U0169_05500 [Polyangiaceae bacterium]